MNRDRFARLRGILARATELPAEERAAYLRDACGGDEELRQEAEAILARESDSPSFLGTGGELSDATADRSRPSDSDSRTPSGPHQIGPYRILEKLGEGGFGEVFAAEQTEPVRRRVALKVLKAGMDTREVLARFEAERQALAMMDHPNVCRVLDAGETPHGRPYFVMELLHGEPITTYCDQHRLSMKDRLDLFLPVCAAIQHAHQKGVIHRDVKPSNVLVTLIDGKPVPKVIDFGIAKAMAQTLTEKTLYTLRGQVIGTPAYMSPEQAEMSGLDVDTRTDVYALGVLLYELLTGRLPFETKTLQEAGFDALRRLIREVEPPKPSTRVSTLGDEAKEAAARRRTDPAHWRKALRRELDWIVMKSLEKDRNRRYETVSGLAADVGRYLADEPVLAGPPGGVYRTQKYVKRHRVAVGFASLVAAGVALAFVLVTAQNDRIAVARDEAEAVTTTLEEMLASVDPTKSGRDVTVKEMLDRTATTLAEKFQGRPLVQARLRHTVGNTYHALGEYDTAETHLERTLEIRSELLGEQNDETLRAMNDLAGVYRQQARYDEAEALARRTLEIRRRVLGNQHRETLAAMRELAATYWAQGRYAPYWVPGRYEEAEALFREILEISRRALGDEHPDTLLAMAGLANSLALQDRFAEAEKLAREALDIQRRVLGEKHPQTLLNMTNLGFVYWRSGRCDEAERLQRETLEIQRRFLGDEHAETLRTMGHLALTYSDQGRHERAEALQRQTLEISRRVLGEEHPQTLRSLEDLAYTIGAQGRRHEAEVLRREAVEISRRVLGPEHPQTALAVLNLAICCRFQRRYDEAETLYREVIEIRRRACGEEHPHTLTAEASLAQTYAKQGRHDEAEELARRTLEIARRALGEDHEATLSVMACLAGTYSTRGRYDEAEVLFRKTLETRRRVLGEEHSQTLGTMTDLAFSLRGLGRHDEAAALRRQILETVGTVHGLRNDTLYDLAGDLALQGKQNEAISVLREVLDTAYPGPEKYRGPGTSILNDPDLASLHGDPEFEVIAEQLRRRNEEEATEEVEELATPAGSS